MDNEITKRLIKENADLKVEIAKLWSVLKKESDSTTKHVGEIYKRIKLINDYTAIIDKRETKAFGILSQHIADLHDIVAPIEQKLFPAAKNTRRQISSIIGPKQLGAGKDLDKKH
jgi:hypothetical protein